MGIDSDLLGLLRDRSGAGFPRLNRGINFPAPVQPCTPEALPLDYSDLMAGLNELDLQHVRACFALARSAQQRGDTPFGARLVGPGGEVLLEASNATISTRDATAHAEIMLVRTGSARYSAADLRQMTLYSSAEPCAMCAGAIAWSGIGRVIFGLSAERVRELAQPAPHAPRIAGRVVLESAIGAPSVSGPVLEAEAAALFVYDASTQS